MWRHRLITYLTISAHTFSARSSFKGKTTGPQTFLHFFSCYFHTDNALNLGTDILFCSWQRLAAVWLSDTEAVPMSPWKRQRCGVVAKALLSNTHLIRHRYGWSRAGRRERWETAKHVSEQGGKVSDSRSQGFEIRRHFGRSGASVFEQRLLLLCLPRKKAFTQHPAHSTHIYTLPPPSLMSLEINTYSLTCTSTHTQMHLDGRCVLFLWCTNNCNCVFKQQVAQRTKNSTVSCRAELLSLRRGGERRRMESRRRCRERWQGKDGRRRPALQDSGLPAGSNLSFSPRVSSNRYSMTTLVITFL